MRLSLTVFGCHVSVQCEDAETRALLVANYSHLQSPRHLGDVRYVVDRPRHHHGAPLFCLVRAGQAPLMAAEAGEFLWLFEKDMTIALQQLRPDLYFVHACVLAFRHRAFMLAGPSGSGKSTTTWALLHHGCRYLSDELGAIDLRTRDVLPYPHAICLKQEPPPAYPLPDQTLCTAPTWHIPAATFPGGVSREATPLVAVFFLQYRREALHPTVHPLSQAAATARLLANALNPLAHPEAGLDGAITLMSGVAPFELSSANLPATCALILEAWGGSHHGNVRGWPPHPPHEVQQLPREHRGSLLAEERRRQAGQEDQEDVRRDDSAVCRRIRHKATVSRQAAPSRSSGEQIYVSYCFSMTVANIRQNRYSV